MAQSEDIGVNRLIADRPDVLTGDGWASRLDLSRRDMGTGMMDDEVAEFRARVNTAALRAYSAAVGRRIQEVVRGLPAGARDRWLLLRYCGNPYGPIASHVRPRRHRFLALAYREEMEHRFQVWRDVTRLALAA
jgi:hypothetical protein